MRSFPVRWFSIGVRSALIGALICLWTSAAFAQAQSNAADLGGSATTREMTDAVVGKLT